MHLVTWNVLHRIHAENWREEVPDRFPDEGERIEAITRRIGGLLEGDDDVVVCLQEVSGDQLMSLRGALPGDMIFSFTYPRVPSLKNGGPAALREASEHLVTIAGRGQLRAAESFPTDAGKGFLAIDVRGIPVFNTHLSFGDKRQAQLARIAALAGDGACVVCGDCNAAGEQVVDGLGPGFAIVDLGPNALPTRPRRDTHSGKPPAIDHIALRGMSSTGGVVVDVAGESDHNLVRAVVLPS